MKSRIEVSFEFRSAYHTTGDQIPWGVDKAVLRWGGEFVLPGSSLKGVVRHESGRLLSALGHNVCVGSSWKKGCLSSPCTICRVFGNPAHPSPMKFLDARPKEGSQEEFEIPIRPRVSLSRTRRSAFEERLFFTEAPPLPRWKTEILGIHPTVQDAELCVATVAIGFKGAVAVGAQRTVGLGLLKELDVKVEIDGKGRELRSLLQRIGGRT